MDEEHMNLNIQKNNAAIFSLFKNKTEHLLHYFYRTIFFIRTANSNLKIFFNELRFQKIVRTMFSFIYD
jgi:hypothetical protein